MTENRNNKNGTFSFYTGVFLISGLVMVLQILQSRIFSVTSWYHLSFLVISMAMFGLTLGALKIYRGNEQTQRRDYSLIARKHTMAFGFFTIIGLLCQLFIPIISGHIIYTFVTLPIVAVTTSAAYYHAGVVITTCLTRSPYPIGRVYGVDLLGAGLGCITALLMMESFDAPSGVLFVAAIGFATAMLFPVSNTPENSTFRLGNTILNLKKTSLAFIAGASLIGGLNIISPSPILFTIWVKDRIVPMSTLAYEDWNSISRITVSNEKKDTHPFLWGPSPKTPQNHRVDGYMLTIDGDAGTPITKFDGDFSEHSYLEYDVINLAYSLPNINTAAIIGVGGGRDLLSAKYFGVEDVTALDVNPVQIKLLKDHPEFRNYSNLYKLPGVTILNEEARSWFRQNDKKLDLVQMSLIDTWAATGAGAFALSENGLYTVEAWSIFMNDLSDHGVFTVSRWTSDTLNDGGRTLSVAMATLFKQGIQDTKKHIVIANSEHIATIIISKSPFTSEQLAAIHDHANKMDYKIILAPDRPSPDGMFGELLQARNIDDLYEIAGRQFFDVSPSTDMRPFFFNQARLSKPFEIIGMLLFSGEATHGVAFGQAKATVNLFIIILFSLIMVGFVIINPLLKTVEDKGSTFIKAGTLYFILIGLGFMLIEISLLQALGVFLGHPIYGLSVLLFSLILSAGIGSFISDFMPLKTLPAQMTWCICAFVYGIALSIYLNGIFDAYAESDIYTRVLASIAIISPAGILMGFGFPTGLGLTEKFDRRATSWFWGINGAAGVLGSSAAIAFNIALGIDKTLILGSFCYLLLAISFLALNSCSVKKS